MDSNAMSQHNSASERAIFEEIRINRDIDLVKTQIKEKYGFDAPDAYVKDLIAFVLALVPGDLPQQ